MTHTLRVLLTLALGTTLAACSSTGMQSSVNISTALQEVTGQNGRACIWGRDIKGFGVLQDDVLSIDAFGDGYYLATVMPGCNDLGLSARAMFQERFGEVCGGGMNRVQAGSSHCQIRHIFEFENREQAFAAHDEAITVKDAANDAESPLESDSKEKTASPE